MEVIPPVTVLIVEVLAVVEILGNIGSGGNCKGELLPHSVGDVFVGCWMTLVVIDSSSWWIWASSVNMLTSLWNVILMLVTCDWALSTSCCRIVCS